MIVNIEREPDMSLYYLGSVLIQFLEQVKTVSIEELLQEMQNELGQKLHVDFLYYALDWLFLLSLVRIEEGKVSYEDKKVNSTQD